MDPKIYHPKDNFRFELEDLTPNPIVKYPNNYFYIVAQLSNFVRS
jgi:hypothetical protein